MSGRRSWLEFTPEEFGHEAKPVQLLFVADDEPDPMGTASLIEAPDDRKIGCTTRS